MSRKMVAQERHVAQDDRLLVVFVHDLIYILLLALGLLDAALPLYAERIEHLPDELLCADVRNTILKLHKLIIHLDDVLSTAMNRHHQFLHLYNFLEPVLVKLL